MSNINKLKGKIVEAGLNVEELSKRANISRSTFYRKLGKNGTDFTILEVYKIVTALQLSTQEAISIFFSQLVACNANEGNQQEDNLTKHIMK